MYISRSLKASVAWDSLIGEINMKAVILVSLALVCLGDIASWAPRKPQWPPVFTAAWNEQTSYSGELKYTGGVAFYDYPNGHLNWTRWDGIADPVCNSSVPLPYDTQCAHMVADGHHYLYTPILGQCCMCCSDENGCGVPPPTTMQKLAFLGQGQFLGQKVYNWQNTVNGYDVTYVETALYNPVNRKWVALFSHYDNYTNVWSFNKKAQSSSFQLPSQCVGADMCGGICTYLRDHKPGQLRATRESLYRGLPLF